MVKVRIVPEIIVANRNEFSRKSIAKRYHKRFQKSHMIAYTLWFILCSLGAHRFYLKQWSAGFILIIVSWVLFLCMFVIHPELEFTELGLIAWLLGVVIFILEGVLLYRNVNKYNSQLMEQINDEVGLGA